MIFARFAVASHSLARRRHANRIHRVGVVSAALLLVAAVVLVPADPAHAATTVDVTVTVDGAASSSGARGGSVTATAALDLGTSVQVNVGGSNGYNGGAGPGFSAGTAPGTGGGASDIRVGGTDLGHRVLVAGGGGGNGGSDLGGGGGGGSGGGGAGTDGAGAGTDWANFQGGGAGGGAGTTASGGAGGGIDPECASFGTCRFGNPGVAGSGGAGGNSGALGGGGGGGGGGWFGGGGGGGGWSDWGGGGGGGGSGYVDPATFPDGASASSAGSHSGNGQVLIAVPGGLLTWQQTFGYTGAAVSYTVSAPPIISSITAKGTTGTVVTITGSSLDHVTQVTFCGTAGTGLAANGDGTSAQVTAPSKSVGACAVGLTSDDVGSGAVANAFVYVAAPTLTDISPSSGTAATTQPVTITGTNLTGATTLTVDGHAVSFTIVSATEISATIPPASTPGTVPVVVTTPGGTAQISYTYTPNPVVRPSVSRIGGIDRIDTAIQVSQYAFGGTGSASAVVLVNANDFADGEAAIPLAAAKHAPILLTAASSLDSRDLTEIRRAIPSGGTVYLIGGVDRLSTGIADALIRAGFDVVRIAGADRYATATAVARALGGPSTVFLADGTTIPDGSTAAAAAAHQHGILLLTAGSSMPATTASYLALHKGSVMAVGGPASRAEPTAHALVGTDRYDTAAKVATAVFAGATSVAIASGTVFADSVVSSAQEAIAGSPLLLTRPNVLPEATSAYLTSVKTSLRSVRLYGDPNALSADVFDEVALTVG